MRWLASLLAGSLIGLLLTTYVERVRSDLPRSTQECCAAGAPDPAAGGANDRPREE